MTDERPHASDCLLELCHLKLDSNRVAYLPAWRNELAEAQGMPKAWRGAKRQARQAPRRSGST